MAYAAPCAVWCVAGTLEDLEAKRHGEASKIRAAFSWNSVAFEAT